MLSDEMPRPGGESRRWQLALAPRTLDGAATGDLVQSGVTLVGVHLRVMLGFEWMMEVEVSCTLRYATAGSL
jgi:hypothetical protein